ncbi:MAG: Heavy metal translocating P-type ATPase, partial [Candidatus Nomurabacteria bacterium GW2011_GWA2_40_9]
MQNNTKIYKVKGMHCASCASIIERAVKKIEGVEEVSVNPGTEDAKISFDESKTSTDEFNKKLEPLGYSLSVQESHNTQDMSASSMGMSEDEYREHLGLNQTKKEKLAELKNMKSMLM